MQVEVLLFGPQAAIVGAERAVVDVVDDATAADVLRELAHRAPGLEESLRTSRLAVNHEFAAADQPIATGDEVALIGMVSGG